MKINNKTVVQYHYTLTDETETLLESTVGSEPSVYLHGVESINPNLEAVMEGKVTGDKFSETLTPERGFGLHKAGEIERMSVKHFRGAKKWKVGMIATIDDHHGSKQVTIVKMGKFMADVDVNHPYAGKTLTFEIEIVDVRAATDEELAHRHVHGVGGHHH